MNLQEKYETLSDHEWWVFIGSLLVKVLNIALERDINARRLTDYHTSADGSHVYGGSPRDEGKKQ